jgi:hypothetical protein
MPRKQNYTLDAAMAVLVQSEGRPSPKSNEPGHTLALHVGGDDTKSGGRLKASAQSSASAPIILNPATNTIATKEEHVEIYQQAGLYPSKNQSRKAYDAAFTAPKDAAGAFLDINQAASILQYALNSADGQNALGKLDGTSLREFFSVSVTGWTNGKADCRKMYCAYNGAGGDDKSDLTHIADFMSVTVGIDKINAGGIHLQTLYPVR